MDWFQTLTGFREGGYEETRARLAVDGETLVSRVNGARYGIGTLELVSLQTLRERVRAEPAPAGRLRLGIVRGDVRRMHGAPENEGALFQVASQFNLLEMIGPDVTPEDGVTRYGSDRTQGPACAIAAGAATLYRNYLVPVEGRVGQRAHRQLDGLADLGATLSDRLALPVSELWTMRNGYALCTQGGLDAIGHHLDRLGTDDLDLLRGRLRIGVHSDVEITDGADGSRRRVSQAFCSALPVAYSRVADVHWRSFAALVLEAAYEATLWAAAMNARRGRSNIVLLTHVGGGAFGNRSSWIEAAMMRALELARDVALDVRIVSYGEPSRESLTLVERFR